MVDKFLVIMQFIKSEMMYVTIIAEKYCGETLNYVDYIRSDDTCTLFYDIYIYEKEFQREEVLNDNQFKNPISQLHDR
jgi:hypothetical protein